MRYKTYKRYKKESAMGTLYSLKGSRIFIIKESDIKEGIKMDDGVYVEQARDDDYNPSVYVYIPENHLLFNLDLTLDTIDVVATHLRNAFAFDYYYDSVRGYTMAPLYKKISLFLNSKAFINRLESKSDEI